MTNITKLKATIEAVLFATGEPVDIDKLSVLLMIEREQTEGIISEMAEDYTDRGIQLVRLDDSVQLCTKEEYGGIVKDALGIRKNAALSRASLETLAIVAYNQPVTRAFIEEVRGVDSSYSINFLAERELIWVSGRLDVPGRPNLYSTTKDFLRIFGLTSITDLPKIEIREDADAPENEQLTLVEN